MNLQCTRAIAGLAALGFTLVACVRDTPHQAASGDGEGVFATQAACDSAIEAASETAPIEIVGIWRKVYQTVGDAISTPLGVDWNPRTGMLAVFDWQLPGVVLFDKQGREIRRILSSGPGPDEFAIRGIMGGGNRIAWENDSTVLVADGKGLLRLAAPRWQPDLIWSVDTLPGAFRGRVHLRVIRDTLIVGWTAEKLAMSGDPARGIVVDLDQGQVHAVRSRLDRWRAFPQPTLPNAPGRAIEPYLNSYRRSWDVATNGQTILVGKKTFGLCWFQGGLIRAAHGASVEPFVFDDDAQTAYVSRTLSGDEIPARELESRKAQFKGRFPPHGPLYQSVWAVENGTRVAALRLDGVASRWLDMYSDSSGGAIRTIRLPTPNFMPFSFRGDTVWGLADDLDAPPAIAAFVFDHDTLSSRRPLPNQ